MNRRIKSSDVTGGMSPIVDTKCRAKFPINLLPTDEAGIFGIDDQSVEIKNDCSLLSSLKRGFDVANDSSQRLTVNSKSSLSAKKRFNSTQRSQGCQIHGPH